MIRKLLLGAAASVLCAPFAFAQDEDTMAADLNAQQLEAFRASVNENYIGEGDIDTSINEAGDVTVDTDNLDATVTEDSTMDVTPPVIDDNAGEAAVEDQADAVEDAADDAAEAIDERADDAEDAARDEADALRDSADEAADDLSHDAEEAVEEAADEAADKIEEDAEAAEEAADQAAEDVEDSADDIRDDIVDDEDDAIATPPYDKPDEADAIKDPSDPN